MLLHFDILEGSNGAKYEKICQSIQLWSGSTISKNDSNCTLNRELKTAQGDVEGEDQRDGLWRKCHPERS